MTETIIAQDLVEFSPTGLIFQSGLTFDQWAGIGLKLQRAERSILWWIGDWLNYGERAYGEMYTQAIEESRYSLHTLQNAKYVASKVESSLRRENLTFKVHEQVAALPKESQIAALDKAEAEVLTVREVRALVRDLKSGIGKQQDLPAGKYSLVYADPPWRYEHVKTGSRAIENQYPTMDLDRIKELPVGDICADDCVLFLWATSPKLAEAIEVIEAWGFIYRTCAVWDKQIIGMGYYFRQQHEFLLVATRGQPGAPGVESRVSSVITWKRGKHSQKPDQAYLLIESMYPDSKRIELFARHERDGWDRWGNQIAQL